MKKYQPEIDRLKKVHQSVKELIDRYPTERRESVIFDKWSLKDVVAHLSVWLEDDVNALNNHMEGKESYWWPDVDEFNEKGVNARKELSWDEVYMEFTTLIGKLHEAYEKMPDDLFEKKMWGKHNGTPLRSINVDIEHWEGEHIPSLESNLK
ncbi:MAG: ClbS/DfsB family four-helix bundle protein [Microgenomates group bacterium]